MTAKEESGTNINDYKYSFHIEEFGRVEEKIERELDNKEHSRWKRI